MYLNLNTCNLPYVNRPAYHSVVLTGSQSLTHIHPTQKKNKKDTDKNEKMGLIQKCRPYTAQQIKFHLPYGKRGDESLRGVVIGVV